MIAAVRLACAVIRRGICGLLGHDTFLHFDQYRVWLQCVTCGYETAGWTIGTPASANVTSSPSVERIETSHAA
jgi:hypothetical protein